MMSNSNDFIIKNALEVGKDTKVTLGTVTSNNVNLSTGNYFADTPSGTSTYTFSNPGDVQAFQLELTGGTAEVASVFSTYLYAGQSTTLVVDNGIDLSGEDGLTWIKCRNAAEDHFLFSSLQNGSNQTLFLETNNTGAAVAINNVSQTSSGFSLPGGDGQINQTGNTYASWTFRKAAGFFDVVTYTGDGAGARTISHNLGTTVGSLIVKKYSTAGQDWFVYHRSAGGADYVGFLNETFAFSNPAYNINVFNNTAPTDSVFSVGSYTNQSGETYVAYLFAHDTAADGLIQCGSYTGTGSSQDITLGWEPQWLMLKRVNNVGGSWYIMDTQRGFPLDANPSTLKADSSDAEGGLANVRRTSTGFNVTHDSGHDWIYIAIRAASDPDITWPASVEWTGGTAPSSPAVGETDVYTFVTDDGGTTYTGIQSADNLS